MQLFKSTALALLLASPMVMAQTAAPAPKPASPAAMQLAQKLFDLNDPGKVFNLIGGSIFQDMMDGAAQQAGDKAACPALKPQVQSFEKQLSTMFSSYNDAAFRQDVAKVYADVYTEKEMREIVGFLQSPTGRKMMAKQAELGQRIGQLGQVRVKAHDTEIRTAYAGFDSRMKTTLATCPAGAPAPAKK